MLARIIWGSSFSLSTSAYLGFGCTTRGEHHVIDSPSGNFSNIFYSTPNCSHSLSRCCRLYGRCRGFCATGIASESISNLTSISFPVFLSRVHPIPLKTCLYSFSNSYKSFASCCFTDLILSSLVSFNVPRGSILDIPNSTGVFLHSSRGEFIFPSITKNFVVAPRFRFRNVLWNSPFTVKVDWSVLKYLSSVSIP